MLVKMFKTEHEYLTTMPLDELVLETERLYQIAENERTSKATNDHGVARLVLNVRTLSGICEDELKPEHRDLMNMSVPQLKEEYNKLAKEWINANGGEKEPEAAHRCCATLAVIRAKTHIDIELHG
jgi:hypothetical protein